MPTKSEHVNFAEVVKYRKRSQIAEQSLVEHRLTLDAYRAENERLRGELERAAAIMQPYIGLANVTASFITLKPEHPLFESIQMDVRSYLRQCDTAVEAKTNDKPGNRPD